MQQVHQQCVCISHTYYLSPPSSMMPSPQYLILRFITHATQYMALLLPSFDLDTTIELHKFYLPMYNPTPHPHGGHPDIH